MAASDSARGAGGRGPAEVSVIVPIYNVEGYLDDCLGSLRRQTFRDIEVIMVNDGSTDGSRQIAERYAAQDSRFRLINRENGGLSAARNSGLSQAGGKYVYFLDSDDYLVDTAIEQLYRRAEKDRLDALKFGAYDFDDNSSDMRWEAYKYHGKYNGVYTGVELLNLMRGFCDNFPSCCLIFMLKEIIEKHTLRFYEGIIHEDNLFHWNLMAISRRTGILNEPLYCRRHRQGSITTTPQYYNAWRSLVTCAAEADSFFRGNACLRGTGIDADYRMFLFAGIRGGYALMGRGLRRGAEARRLHKIERELLKRGRGELSLDMLLYLWHPDLFILCEKLLCIVNNILKK